MGEIIFKNGVFIVPSVKTAEGPLHERINQRADIVQAREFLDKHPFKGKLFD